MNPSEQVGVLAQLRQELEDEDDANARRDITMLLRNMRRRPDATYRSVSEIDALLATIDQAPPIEPETPGQPVPSHGPFAERYAPAGATTESGPSLAAPSADRPRPQKVAAEKQLSALENEQRGLPLWTFFWRTALTFGVPTGIAAGIQLSISEGLAKGLIVCLTAILAGGPLFALSFLIFFVLPARLLLKAERRVVSIKNEVKFREALKTLLPRYVYRPTINREDLLQFEQNTIFGKCSSFLFGDIFRVKITISFDHDRKSATVVGPRLTLRAISRAARR
jgi:hypothetical protein